MKIFLQSMVQTKKIAKDFNDEYTKALGNTIEYVENSFELVSSLKGKYKQYIVSNGAKMFKQFV